MLGRPVALLLLLTGCDAVFGLEERTPDQLPFVCPASFRPIAGSFYGRFDPRVTWHEAEAACEALTEPESSGYVHLVVISSDAELAAIVADLTVSHFWIGHHDIAAENVFVPVTGEPVNWPPLTMPPWADEQPNNLNENQNCLISDGTNLLDDKYCATDVPDEQWRYVCECDAFPSTAPLPP